MRKCCEQASELHAAEIHWLGITTTTVLPIEANPFMGPPTRFPLATLSFSLCTFTTMQGHRTAKTSIMQFELRLLLSMLAMSVRPRV